MGYQTGVVAALKDYGLTLGYVTGWETRGSSSFNPRGHVCHHDAIPTRWDFPPGILIGGRSDLPGPLCNFALARNGTVWMVAAGRANHAGTGSWRGLVGNSSVWGTEANNAGTGQDWPDEQIDAYVRLCAATCDYSGFGADMVCRHAEWTSRKIDPYGPWQDGHRWEHDMSHFRALVANTDTGGFGNMDDRQILDEFANATKRTGAQLDALADELREQAKRHNAAQRDRDVKILAVLERIANKIGA